MFDYFLNNYFYHFNLFLVLQDVFYTLLFFLVLSRSDLLKSRSFFHVFLQWLTGYAGWILLSCITDYFYPSFLLCSLLSGIFYYFLYTDFKPQIRIILISLYLASWVYSPCLTAYFIRMATVNDYMLSLIITSRIIYMLIITAIIVRFSQLHTGKNIQVPFSMSLLMFFICSIGIITELLLRIFTPDFVAVSSIGHLIIILGNQSVDLLAFFIFQRLIINYNKATNLLMEQKLMETQLTSLQTFHTSYESLHELRHEIKNQYSYIQMLLEKKEYDRAKNFFGEMSMHANPVFSYLYSGNELVDNIVNLEIARAKSLDITIDIKVAVPPELPFSESDLCSLLLNLIDNAIDACVDLPLKKISFSMIKQENYVMIHVSNPTARTIPLNGQLILHTTKSNKELHGYGTRIIKNIVEKYDGAIQYKNENQVFTAEVMLSLKEGD